jgi:hypothetical protein
MEATTIGIGWEIFEYNFGNYVSYENMINKQYTEKKWWGSSSYDIIFNTVGLMTGICLNRFIEKK